jgi:hypothetical protein
MAMKKMAILLSLVMLFTVSCVKSGLEFQPISGVSSTPCKQDVLKSIRLPDQVEVAFTDNGLGIMYRNFEVSCDFTTVNVAHTFENGVLRITQQGAPGQANCICYTDVAYTIEGILPNDVNVIFINDEQVYCYEYANSPSGCDPNVIIDREEYFNVPEFRGNISNMKIEGDSLKFTLTASGCSASSWIVKLITTGAIQKTLPPQRTFQLSFENTEMCTAVVSRAFSFHIECLRIEGYPRIRFHIAGNDIVYEYGDNGS